MASARLLLGGFARALRGLALFLGLAAALGVLAFALVFPFWYLASHHSRLYSYAALAALAGFIVFLLFRRFQRRSRLLGGFRPLAQQRILPALRTTGIVLASLAGLYGIALLASRLFR